MDGATLHVDSPQSLKKEWVLTQEAFDRLLLHLDADREQAGDKYERLRLKLLKYFEWRGAADPDRLADETLNRVARRINDGEQISNLNAYCYGVARLVFSESLKTLERTREALEHAPPPPSPPPPEEDLEVAARLTCLSDCLGRIPEENRELIIEYYQDERGRKIERRRKLADRLGIPLNALRIRAYRIRVGLESCVRHCVGAPQV